MEVELWNAQEELCCTPTSLFLSPRISVTHFASPVMHLDAPVPFNLL